MTIFKDPNGWFPQLIRSLRAISLLILILLVPYQFAFKHKANFDEIIITYVLIAIDILYAIKLIFQSFMIPYVDRQHNTINRPKLIFKNFIK
jgi:hypothetical protein